MLTSCSLSEEETSVCRSVCEALNVCAQLQSRGTAADLRPWATPKRSPPILYLEMSRVGKRLNCLIRARSPQLILAAYKAYQRVLKELRSHWNAIGTVAQYGSPIKVIFRTSISSEGSYASQYCMYL